MKKIFNLLLSAVAVIGITTSCSDVPAPYDINQGGEISFGKVMPYKSASLSTGWTTNKLSENEPWSQGSSYTQATGYQDWDGAGSKTNKEVEGYLISPALNTKSESGKAKFSFDYTIKYTNNVSDWQSRHKILISKNYDGKEFKPEQWEELNWVGTASPYSDWTLYSSGDIQIPEAYTNKDSIYVAFHFSAPASSSTTWELMNFLIQEGEAEENPDKPDTPSDAIDITCAKAVELCAALGDGATSAETYAITGYITDVYANISNGQQSFWMADTQDGGKMVQAYWANLPEGVSSFAKGQKVKIVGQLLKYVKDGNVTTEIKNATVIILEGGEGGDVPGDAIDITCAKAVELCAALTDGATSTETYSVTGYITDVYSTISKGQQSFWMADTQDGGKVLQAYWANLPQGVSAFKVGSKVKIVGQLLKYVKDGNVTTEIKNATVIILEEGNGGGNTTTGTEVNCAKAAELCNALADGATSTDTYTVTGYITDVYATVSKGQQSFWMADEKGDTKVLQAYWANLPQGVEKFTKNSKVKITGKLLKYVKDGNVTSEIKNADVQILEVGTDEGGNNDNTGTVTPGTSEGISISGTTVTLTNSAATAGTETVDVVVNDLSGLTDKGSAEGTFTLPDGSTLTVAKGEGKSGPTYYAASNGFRIYASNTLTFDCKKNIAVIVMECDEYNNTKYVGNTTATVSFSGKQAVYCNKNEANSGGTQLRVKTIKIYYAK